MQASGPVRQKDSRLKKKQKTNKTREVRKAKRERDMKE